MRSNGRGSPSMTNDRFRIHLTSGNSAHRNLEDAGGPKDRRQLHFCTSPRQGLSNMSNTIVRFRRVSVAPETRSIRRSQVLRSTIQSHLNSPMFLVTIILQRVDVQSLFVRALFRHVMECEKRMDQNSRCPPRSMRASTTWFNHACPFAPGFTRELSDLL
jgi:hypothetical protein